MIALCVATQLPLIPLLLPDGNERIVGLMAKHIRDGRELLNVDGCF